MDKKRAYEIVFQDLLNIPMFNGKYFGNVSSDHFMYGISTVMEVIAYNISEETCGKFEDMFLKNMIRSEAEFERRCEEKKKKNDNI